MNRKQKRIVAVLAAAAIVVIVALVLQVSLSLRAIPSPPAAPTSQAEVPTPPDSLISTGGPPSPASYEVCQWKAAQHLTHAGLDGAVALTPDGILRFDITYSLAPGQVVDEAAQSIWLAFDIALALLEEECDLFTQVEVVVLAQGSQTVTCLSARVSAADLVAFDAGELSEDQFIARVTYHVGDE